MSSLIAILYFSIAVSDGLPTDTVTQSVNLDEVVITEQALDKLKVPEIGVATLSQQEILNVPTLLGEPDVVKALQLQPGVSAGTEGFAGMYVRGGNNDENLFIIDGNPVYQINHIGGLFSSFNVNAIRKLDFFKSSFPARYGGRLSSVVDISTREGDTTAYHGNFSIGLLSGNVNVEGPIIKGKSSFNFSVRRSWLELLSIPTLAILNSAKDPEDDKLIGGYSFSDLNFKASHWFRPHSKLSLTLYYGSDRLKLGEESFYVDGNDKHTASKYINNLYWGNIITALRWEHRLNRRISMDVNASFTHYFSQLKHDVDEYHPMDENCNWQYEYSYKDTRNKISDWGLNTNFAYGLSNANFIRFGIGYIHHTFTPEDARIKSSSTNGISYQSPSNSLSADEYYVYAEDDINISYRLMTNIGLRLSLFNVGNKTHSNLEPRFSVNYRLSDFISLKAGYSRMSQYVQQISNNFINFPTDFWMPITENFRPLTSDQIAGGIYYCLKNKFTFSLEGYYKWLDNLLEYRDDYNLLPASASWEDKLAVGKGTAYGIDFTIEKTFGRLTGYLGYGLMWTNRSFPELNNGVDFPAKYDNRHKFNISLNFKINEKIDINAGWTFMSGNRVTLPFENYQNIDDTGLPNTLVPDYPYEDEWGMPYYSGKNNYRLPAYHRLDLGMSIKTGKRSLLNISVYNAYCNMNPIVIERSNLIQESSGERLQPKFRTISIFPIIPSISYTYKF